MANILDRLVSSPLTDLVGLHVFAYLDYDSGSFVAGTFDSKLGHAREIPIIHHEMDVAEAETSRIELDQDVIWTWKGENCQ